MKIQKGTIIRTILLAVAMINQFLIISGHEALPYDENALASYIGTTIDSIIFVIAWWKNNSFTKWGIQGDIEKERVKAILKS